VEEGCWSSRLDQLLTDLADIDPRRLQGSGATSSDGDDGVVAGLAAELSLGWLAGSTTLCVGGQTTVVPNVVDAVCQKLLLHRTARVPAVTQLSVYDVEQQLDHITSAADV